jgi:hypothetical protein
MMQVRKGDSVGVVLKVSVLGEDWYRIELPVRLNLRDIWPAEISNLPLIAVAQRVLCGTTLQPVEAIRHPSFARTRFNPRQSLVTSGVKKAL